MGIIGEIIGTPLGWIMYLLYSLFKNYGVCILVFTIITKLILVPVSVSQQKSQAAMSAFSPKLEQLKKKYKNNQQKLQEEQMKLYSEEGINPMASCLPMVLQLLILYGVFDVIYRPLTHILRISKDVITQATQLAIDANLPYATEKMLKSRPEILLVKAAKDNPEVFSSLNGFTDTVQGFNNTLFGFIDLGQIPSVPEVWNAASIGLFMIPILAGVFQILNTLYMQIRQKKQGTTMPQGMGSMNVMMYGFSILFIYIAFTTPAGVGFYWILTSLFGLLQSIILYKIYTPEYVAVLVEKDKAKKKKKKNGRPSLSERYQKFVEEQQGLVENKTTEKKDSDEDADEDDDSKLTSEEKISKSKQREMERAIIKEARRRQAEKYGDEYTDDDDK